MRIADVRENEYNRYWIMAKIWVLIKALFRRCTLCTSRKSDEIRAQIFQEMPKADCAVLP